MKIWKLVSGILSIILSLFVVFQSMFAGMANALDGNGEISGTAGLFVAVFMLAAGIVSIVVRNSEKKGGDRALIVLFLLAAVLGYTLSGSFTDLKIWATWCLICGILSFISMRKKS
ncbi:MAG: hypothetical protein SO178_06075 [Floccifex porci]|uniref:Uncharacterized protein n=1 Tax=Floccifex porci TaxID=2606629 RepID=A0A7X2N4D6_9FIRM|nr:hypothetical protein [Floccifex porci]MDD7467654.1 hypothetical protein [Floccifex porci]MDO4480471.1 hypothetical protein [Erysipelotrichaceae bacterium]MDY4797221.1 hypothetical protein [Floccifex porci]MSS02233.1 hypothetical protein [Floccifex porci]